MLLKTVCLSLVTLAAGQVVPGNVPGLVPGSPAANQWWSNQLIWQQQQVNARGKRQASLPVTPGNIAGLTEGTPAAAQWWAAQQNHSLQLTPGNIAGLVPGSLAAAQWWNAQNIHRGQLAHHVGKRQATEWPAGVSPASCPNFPYCNLSAAAPIGYVNTAGFPAGVSAAACPGYPYC